jgi:putative solute:sodium symporter small subunit
MGVRPGKERDGAPVDTNKQPDRPVLPARYWQRLRLLTLCLLLVWGAVTLLVPWFALDLNRWQLAGMPLGLWMASQGAIALYLLLIVIYALACDRLERGLDVPVAALDRVRHD